jgi:hypothetical protein
VAAVALGDVDGEAEADVLVVDDGGGAGGGPSSAPREAKTPS